MYLQSDLLRIVTYSIADNGNADVDKVLGTGFLVHISGAFLTAAHVLQLAFKQCAEDQFVGVVGHDKEGTHVARLLSYEFAPDQRDVAIGISLYSHPTVYRPSSLKCEIWQEVATCGFPEDAIYIDNEDKKATPLRAFKGIIQRVVQLGALAHLPRSEGYELSFTPSPGVSGAPLFIYSKEQCTVIGVCVGSFRSEQIEDEMIEVDDNGKKYKETRIRVVQFGFAETLAPLSDWKPKLLGGSSLCSLTAEPTN